MKTLLCFTIVIFLISGTTFAQQQFENGGFEEWEEVGLGSELMEPVNWSSIKTSDDNSLSNAAPVVWGKSDDAHTGSHSLYLKNVGIFGIVVAGTITNGRVHADFNPDNGYVFTDVNDSRWSSPFTWRPDSVVGWYLCNPAEDDFGTVKVALHSGDLSIPGSDTNIVALAYMELASVTQSTWTRFSMPFLYYQQTSPDYYLSILTAGNGVNAVAGGEIWFDDLRFIYNNSSVGENKFDDLSVYSSNGNINIFIKGNNTDTHQIIVNDLMGRQIYYGNIAGGENLKISTGIENGVYIVSVIIDSKKFSRKLVIN